MESFFTFKHFTVFHDECAMKVGTDGTLLGAWATVDHVDSVLDVGCGCGLIALMIAQRSSASTIIGIDNHEPSIRQAARNTAASDWSDRLRMSFHDVRDLTVEEFGRFDLIVSNPPFYEEDVSCPDLSRNSARHTGSLNFDQLVDAAVRLLSDNGTLSLILPAKSRATFVGTAASRGLYLSRITSVYTKHGKPPKRVLMEFGRSITDTLENNLYIYKCRGDGLSSPANKKDGLSSPEICRGGSCTRPQNNVVFSEEYVDLLKDFYLNL